MKKFLIVFLAIVSVVAVAVTAIVFIPKAVNESSINKLSSGGVQDGATTFSLNDAFEGSAKVENGKMEFCFTQIDGKTEFVQEINHLYLIGEYSVGLDKNITLKVEECYNMLELVGTEKDIENYKKIKTKRYQDYLDKGNYTQQQYDREMALINGEKAYPMNEEGNITSAKLRMDTETGKVYLMSYKSSYATVEYSYHENGAIKSETAKLVGLIPGGKIEYDTKGNQLKDGSEREFYDDGVIKRESLYIEESNSIQTYEYDTEGRLLKFSQKISGTSFETYADTYEYNADGICVAIKYGSGFGEAQQERQIIAYGHEMEISIDSWSDGTEMKSVKEIFGGETIKETREHSGDIKDVDYYENNVAVKSCRYVNGQLTTEDYLNENGDTVEGYYYENGKFVNKALYYYTGRDVTKIEEYNSKGELTSISYYENRNEIKETQYENGQITEEYYFNENGDLIETHYYENGKLAWKSN